MFHNLFTNLNEVTEKIKSQSDFFALQDFHINISSAILTYQHAMLALMQKSQSNELMQTVMTSVISEFNTANSKLWSNFQVIQHYYTKLMMYYYGTAPGSATPSALDKLFKSDEWNSSVFYSTIKNVYKSNYLALFDTLAYVKSTEHQKMGGDGKALMTEREWHILDFFYKQIFNFMSPKNLPFTNPDIINQITKTHGKCLRDGAENFLNDVRKMQNGIFNISTVNKDAFVIGKNIAITPGKVVYQNDLFQLIRYDSSTESVHSIPILITTAWINKYYILDLQPDNSLIKWLVDKGYVVFVISWVNPDKSYANKTFEDYVCDGFVQAVEEVKKLTGQEQVNCISYCLGGTLTTVSASYLAAISDHSIKSMTLLTTLIDFKVVGDVKIFTSEEILSAIDKDMEKNGFLDGHTMFSMFLWLRSNDMVWSYYINNYMLGQPPKSFDVLFWNADSTRMPYKMHSFYLRNMYAENNLVKANHIKIRDVGIDVSKIALPIYCVANQEDHIAPWISVYEGMTHLTNSDVRFVLTKAGHVIGIVNPPSTSKYSYYTNDTGMKKTDHKEWLQNSKESTGSWWNDWDKWMKKNNLRGTKITPTAVDSSKIIEEAPGSYVKA